MLIATRVFHNHWLVILCFLLLSASCADHEHKPRQSNYTKLDSSKTLAIKSINTTSKDDSLSNDKDTVTVRNGEELIRQIRSNRLIKLINHEYILKATLLLEHITNLKIEGTEASKLSIQEKNATVFKLSNTRHIDLDHLIIGHTESPGYEGEPGVLHISHSEHINISNCQLHGAGTFGLITDNVSHLEFSDSEIMDCSVLIFELKKSSKIKFINSKFHHNNLSTAVLGGFTNSTIETSFLNCDFLNNTPAIIGNPAFNFMDNYADFKDQILFTNCTFKNNKGFKWYGDKIKLDNCTIDSTDFIGFE